MQHKLQGNVFLSHVTHVVIDEVDTMLTQGFGSDIRAILRSVMLASPPAATASAASIASTSNATDVSGGAVKSARSAGRTLTATASVRDHSSGAGAAAVDSGRVPKEPAQLIMATATLTKAVRSLLMDVQGGFNIDFSGELR